MNDPRPTPDYTRLALDIGDAADAATVWRALTRLPTVVAVNIVNRDGRSVLLDDAAIAGCLASGVGAIEVEAVSEAHYRAILTAKIEQLLGAVVRLRAVWRTHSMRDTAEELQALLRLYGETVWLLTIYVRQREDATLARGTSRLSTLRTQLAASAFQFDDTVRGMDDLHYEIAPLLSQLRAHILP